MELELSRVEYLQARTLTTTTLLTALYALACPRLGRIHCIHCILYNPILGLYTWKVERLYTT
jgi:hypothetical protein